MARAIEILAGFDGTYAPDNDVDVSEACGHFVRRDADFDLVVAAGIKRLRYPVRWHRIEQTEGVYDWSDTDAALGALADRGLQPILDLLHHTSHPRWLTFADKRFGASYQRFVEAFALRYPNVAAYTLFNEPFSTLFLSGGVGAWPPYYSDVKGMISLWRNVLPAWAAASRMCRDLLPRARHFHVDTVERHSGPGSFTEIANDRRFAVLDLMLGIDLDRQRPFLAHMIKAGGADLLEMQAGRVDVVGLDYYAHNQWYWDAENRGRAPSPEPSPLADLIVEYWQRYDRPCFLGETNVRGTSSDRASWFKYTLEQCERARDAGVPFEGHCWFPFIDSCDWDSLLRRADGNIDPVGIYTIDSERNRAGSQISETFALAASGATSSALTAYHFQWPVQHWLKGWHKHMEHWKWHRPTDDYLTVTPDADRTDGIGVDFDPLGAINVA